MVTIFILVAILDAFDLDSSFDCLISSDLEEELVDDRSHRPSAFKEGRVQIDFPHDK
jgi:hypothetical protein